MMNTARLTVCQTWQICARLNDRLFRRGCDFSGWMTQESAGFSAERGNKYQPTTDSLAKVLRRLPITADDVILDIGCGKGKAMYIMSRFPFRRIEGYDLSPKLVEIARDNFTQLRLPRCRVFEADAAEYDDYDEVTYFYMFNAVPREVFLRTLAHINASLARRPRKCCFLYMNPVYHMDLLTRSPFRLKFTQKAPISWLEFRCYEYHPPIA